MLSLNPSLNTSPRASISNPADASLPLVLCNLLQKEFSAGVRSPVAGGVGPLGAPAFPSNKHIRRRKGEEHDDEDG